MTRTERLLRLARLRGDRLAIAVLESRRPPDYRWWYNRERWPYWSESEMRAAWGDR